MARRPNFKRGARVPYKHIKTEVLDMKFQGRGAFIQGLEKYQFDVGMLVKELGEKYNLTVPQMVFLMERYRFQTDAACVASLRISLANTGGDLVGAKTEYFRRLPEVAAKMMRSLYPLAVERTGNLLDAERTIRTKDGPIKEPNYNAMAKGIEIVLRHEGKFEGSSVYESAMEEFYRFLKTKNDENALPEPAIA